MSEMDTAGSMSPFPTGPPVRNSNLQRWNNSASNGALDSFNDADVDDYSTQVGDNCFEYSNKHSLKKI